MLALTASATPEVQEDICVKLKFVNGRSFRQSFERPNLSYSLFEVDSKINKLVEILNNVPGTGIVYCRSRKQCQNISALLRMNNIQSDFYHAGLSQDERNRRQQEWLGNHIRVMVCTNAFGMGIDKPDVRTVVHVDIPDCLENYYQEAGRAGRDGKRAYAVLLYHEQELKELLELPLQQFPSLEDIRNVYQSLMNYLQVPSGSGAETYYPFDLGDMIRKFSLDMKLVLASLRVLEQEEVVGFNEQVFLPPKVQFTSGKKQLHEFEQAQPALEPMVKILLRTYEGIFDFPTAINELLLAKLLRADKAAVIKQLQLLHAYHIIAYEPQVDSPQIYFFRNRSATAELNINMPQLLERKQRYEDRVKKMHSYVIRKNECRGQFIASYFGDAATRECGICDNCLRNKSRPLTDQEFTDIHNRIIDALQQPADSKALLQQLKAIKKEKAWQVINYLQAETRLEVDAMGVIKLKLKT